MAEAKKIERELVQSLKKQNIRSVSDKEAVAFLDTIRKLIRKRKFIDSAAHYAALALILEHDAGLALQSARSYQKANALDDAARWYLITANRYAQSAEASKAVAALRIYMQLKPDDHERPRKIYDLCLQNGADDSNPPSILVNDADRAGSKLLASEFFETFDSSHFEHLIKQLTYRKYTNGHIINKMGEEASCLYIIISGAVSGYLTLNNKRTYLGDIGENNIFGETAYFTGGRRTAETIANGITEVFELPYALLDEFKQNHPDFNERIEKLYKHRMLVKQLALTPLFESVTAQCREWVASHMKPIAVKAGTTLMTQDEEALDLYLVRSGKLAITLKADGRESLIKTVETGAIIGETAIAAKNKRTASVRSITNCILMKLDEQQYKTFYAGSKPVQKALSSIKKSHIAETLNMMKQNNEVEGDDTCEVLIKDIWSEPS